MVYKIYLVQSEKKHGAYALVVYFLLLLLLMVHNFTFNTISVISWRAVLLVEETRVFGENHRPTCRKSLTNLSHKTVSSHLAWEGLELASLVVIGTDCICRFNPTTIRSWPRRPLTGDICFSSFLDLYMATRGSYLYLFHLFSHLCTIVLNNISCNSL